MVMGDAKIWIIGGVGEIYYLGQVREGSKICGSNRISRPVCEDVGGRTDIGKEWRVEGWGKVCLLCREWLLPPTNGVRGQVDNYGHGEESTSGG